MGIGRDSQRCQHVSRADAVDTNAGMGPFDRQASRQMPHRRLGGIVWRLRLRDVDDASRHAANHDDAARGLSLHQMLRHADRKEVGPIDVDSPQLLHPVIGVRDRVIVLRKSGRSDQVVDLAVVTKYIGNRCVHRLGRRDIGIMGGDLGNSVECQKHGLAGRSRGRIDCSDVLLRAWVLTHEVFDQALGLPFGFLLCETAP